MAHSVCRFRRARFVISSVVPLSWLVGVAACSFASLDDLTSGVMSIEGPEPTAETASGLYLPEEGRYAYVQNTSAYARANDFPDASPDTLGVDRLATHGSISLRLARDQASILEASITHLEPSGEGACWTLHIDIHPNSSKGGHQEQETYCARDDGLFARAGESAVQNQIWNLLGIGTMTTEAVVECPSSTVYLTSSMKPGDVWQHRCTGTATMTSGPYTSDGPYTYVARELMTIDGASEQVRHLRRERTVGGSVIGKEVTELYLSVKDGLPLRIRRYTHITTPVSILGVSKVDYDNDGSDWLLRTREPLPFAEDASTEDAATPPVGKDAGHPKDAGNEEDDAGSDDAGDAP